MNDTVIVVGVTRVDGYNNLWVTPAGGGEEIKVGAKRGNLHSLFQQGKAIMLHWETYKNISYVSDAKLVEGELPSPTKPTILPEHKEVISKAKAEAREPIKPQLVEHKSSPETGMWWKELGDMLRSGDIDKTTPLGKVMRSTYYTEMGRVLGIPIKEVQPVRKSLVEEALKLGAVVEP